MTKKTQPWDRNMWCKEIITKTFIEKPVKRNYINKRTETQRPKIKRPQKPKKTKMILLYTNARGITGKVLKGRWKIYNRISWQ